MQFLLHTMETEDGDNYVNILKFVNYDQIKLILTSKKKLDMELKYKLVYLFLKKQVSFSYGES